MQKEKDLQEINDLMRYLTRVTNHNIKIRRQNSNIYIVVANQEEIKDLILKNIEPKKTTDDENKEESSALGSLGLKPKPAL